jgi:glutamate-1-semialdehyde aminotransferase
MELTQRTWISSTLATEFVALAAANVVVEIVVRDRVVEHLRSMGRLLLDGLATIQARYPDLVTRVGGIPEMCYLQFTDEAIGAAVAVQMARRGVLFKRQAYNFVSLAHGATEIARCHEALGEAFAEVRG